MQAAPVTFSGSANSVIDGTPLSASVKFDIVGGNLQVTLTNTSLADVLLQPNILTAVFFDITGNPSLTVSSAVLAPGSTVLFGGTDPGGVVGGEWVFKSGLTGAPYNTKYMISSAGFGLSGNQQNFPGTNLQGPVMVDGVQYGITSAGNNPLTGQLAVKGENALIKNSVVFTFGSFSNELTSINNVFFQYGTALIPTDPGFKGDPPVPPAPEPSTILLLGTGLIGLIVWRRFN